MSDDLEWAERFADAGVQGWVVRESIASTEVRCGSFSAAGSMAAAVARVCDEQNHHAELDVRYPDLLRVSTWSHDVGGLSQRDIRLARAINDFLAQREDAGG